MKITIKVYRKIEFEIPEEALDSLKMGLCSRWEEEYDPKKEWDDFDILVQADHDGLIDLPEEDWEVD